MVAYVDRACAEAQRIGQSACSGALTGFAANLFFCNTMGLKFMQANVKNVYVGNVFFGIGVLTASVAATRLDRYLHSSNPAYPSWSKWKNIDTFCFKGKVWPPVAVVASAAATFASAWFVTVLATPYLRKSSIVGSFEVGFAMAGVVAMELFNQYNKKPKPSIINDLTF